MVLALERGIMEHREKLALKIGCRVDSLNKHIRLAKKRNASWGFVTALQDALRSQVGILNALTSKARPVACAGLVALLMAVSGCATIRGVGTDIVNGADSTVRALESYSRDYNSQQGRAQAGY